MATDGYLVCPDAAGLDSHSYLKATGGPTSAFTEVEEGLTISVTTKAENFPTAIRMAGDASRVITKDAI